MEFPIGVSKIFIKPAQNEELKKETRKRGQCIQKKHQII